MPETTPTAYSGDASINGVLGDWKWAVRDFTFSFPTNASFYEWAYGRYEPAYGFSVLNSAQQTAARAAFEQLSSVANVTFTEITESATQHADLRLAQSTLPDTAWAYYPSSTPEGGDSWFGSWYGYYQTPAKGNYAFVTFLHEIGHALGLDHAHEGIVMPANHASIEYTAMSYSSYPGASPHDGYTNETWGFAQSLMMYDIAALQHMYGADYSTQNGNTVYSWSPTTGEMFINGVGQGVPGDNRIFLTVWDGGGTDTYDFSNYATAVKVDLRPGKWTTTSASQLAKLLDDGSKVAVGNIANALLHDNDARSLVENAIGGSADDSIIGNILDNALVGGRGNDHLDGGEGHDLLWGGTGNDTLTGGLGADTFLFNWSELQAGANDTVTDYTSVAGDILKVMGGHSSLIGLTFSVGEAVLSLGQATNSIHLASGSLVTVEWHPTETAIDFSNAVILRFAAPGQEAWSQSTQNYDAAGRFDLETGVYANGGGWLYDLDQANGSDLRYFRNEFSANFTLTSQLGQYDDGRQWQDIYNEGRLATKTWIDLENTGTWARFTDTYDQSNGLLDSEVGSHDSGAGWLFDMDQTNVTWFRYFRNEFTSAFQMTRQIGQTDDGRIWDDLYDSGQLTKTHWTDAEDTQVWLTVTDTYGDYGNGHTIQRLYMFDDGSHAWQLI